VNSLAKNTTKGEMSPTWPIPVGVVGFSPVVNNYFDKPRPIPIINLERIQATTSDLATFLGISLPEPIRTAAHQVNINRSNALRL
jgi:hypothetical protein